MFGNLGKMGEMLKQAKQLKDEMARSKYEAESGGVRAVINGELEITDLKIPPDMLPAKIESAVKDAVNRGLKNAKADMAQKMSKMTGGLKLPGM